MNFNTLVIACAFEDALHYELFCDLIYYVIK